MEQQTICPKCKGQRFIKVKTMNEMGYEYEIYKPCDCIKNTMPREEHKNPFTEEGEKK